MKRTIIGVVVMFIAALCLNIIVFAEADDHSADLKKYDISQMKSKIEKLKQLYLGSEITEQKAWQKLYAIMEEIADGKNYSREKLIQYKSGKKLVQLKKRKEELEKTIRHLIDASDNHASSGTNESIRNSSNYQGKLIFYSNWERDENRKLKEVNAKIAKLEAIIDPKISVNAKVLEPQREAESIMKSWKLKKRSTELINNVKKKHIGN